MKNNLFPTNNKININIKINKFFVYGTLRPDYTAPWSDIVHKNPNFSLKYYKALLPHSKIFHNNKIGYPVILHNKHCNKDYLYETQAVGYILEVLEGETSNLNEALKLFDEIEEYPELYDRSVIECINVDKGGVIDEVYFYHMRPEDIDEENDLIEFRGNDFLNGYCV